MRRKAILLNAKDDVATALTNLEAGEKVVVSLGDERREVKLQEEIQLGHKLALRDIAKGETVLKYGVSIGNAAQDIRAGEHVHEHNLASFHTGRLRAKYGRRT